MPVERRSPTRVPELRGGGGGPDDVGEQHGEQTPVRVRRRERAGEKFLDLVEHFVTVLTEPHVVGAVDLDVARVRDVIGDVTTHSRADDRTLRALEHESRRLDVGQVPAEVREHGLAEEVGHGSGR
ncbi:MAG TPA: hypothetical protein VK549_12065, partial [Acidimicrobiia bacterium]|nr:hypothetical protein [Acidimicrobiia bacterium]